MCYYFDGNSFIEHWVEFTDNSDDKITLDEVVELTMAVNLHDDELTDFIMKLPSLSWDARFYSGVQWKRSLPQYVHDQINQSQETDARIRSGNLLPQDRIKHLLRPGGQDEQYGGKNYVPDK